MKIELFHAPGCERCAPLMAELQAAAAMSGVEWCEINVLDSLERAVELGVLTLPALAIDGVLVFATLPTPAQLREALRQRDKDA
ncbi:MAG TPA: thioredoxin family protein [Pseudomonas sp.]|nr:thioredoxin family protein [Pseudomonas sp.]